MAYITLEYYRDDFKGAPIEDDATLERLIMRATDLIDVVTNYNLHSELYRDWENIPNVAENVRKATAAQVEYLATFGEMTANTAIETPVLQVGKFRYGLIRGGNSQGVAKDPRFSTATMSFLRPTGLLYKGVGC